MLDEPGHEPAEAPEPRGESPLTVESQGDAYTERPELFVGGAFLGGLVLAQILRRVGDR